MPGAVLAAALADSSYRSAPFYVSEGDQRLEREAEYDARCLGLPSLPHCYRLLAILSCAATLYLYINKGSGLMGQTEVE